MVQMMYRGTSPEAPSILSWETTWTWVSSSNTISSRTLMISLEGPSLSRSSRWLMVQMMYRKLEDAARSLGPTRPLTSSPSPSPSATGEHDHPVKMAYSPEEDVSLCAIAIIPLTKIFQKTQT